MNKKQILYLVLAIAFILLNISGLFLAAVGAPPIYAILTLSFSFVLGILLYFILRFHNKEVERRKMLEEMSKEDKTNE